MSDAEDNEAKLKEMLGGATLDEHQRSCLAGILRSAIDCMSTPQRAHGVFIIARNNMLQAYSVGASGEEAEQLLYAATELLATRHDHVAPETVQ